MGMSNYITDRIYVRFLRARIFTFNLWNKITGPAILKMRISNNKPLEDFSQINSDKKREVKIEPSDKNLTEVIFSCYFINQADPIHGLVRTTPDIEYIAPWYKSIEKIGATGVIIHDGIDEEFISKYQTDRILFRKYTPGRYSIFEERWFSFYLFLSGTNIKRAFITDINDVYITKIPFGIISNSNALYVGRDIANKIKNSGWLLEELKDFEQDSSTKTSFLYKFQYAYNAGVVGGSREVLLFLISKIINKVLLTQTNTHKDMTILNLCIYQYFFPTIDSNIYSPSLTTKTDDQRAAHSYLVTGYPLNSDFKKYDLSSDAYFIHK